MEMVLLTAIGVGGATVFGAVIGFVFKNISHKFSDIVLSFAAGVMLSAAILGLILPSVEYGNLFITIAGIFVGAISLNLIDRLVPHLHRLVGVDGENPNSAGLSKVLLFVSAIAIHNLPEGAACGAIFAGILTGEGTVTLAGAVALSIGIAIQNFPEGVIISLPMRGAGYSKVKAFAAGAMSGIVEPIGAVAVLFLASAVTPVLPYLLAFAAGAMIYVAVKELLPAAAMEGASNLGTLTFAVGFAVMMVLDVVLA